MINQRLKLQKEREEEEKRAKEREEEEVSKSSSFCKQSCLINELGLLSPIYMTIFEQK